MPNSNPTAIQNLINTEETRRFLTALDINDETADFRTIQDYSDTRKRPPIKFRGSLSHHGQSLATRALQGDGVFLIVNECDGEGQKAENVVGIRALFADLDGVPLSNVSRITLPPTITVQTSPDKYHVYWVCDDIPTSEFKGLQQRIAKLIGSDPAVCDLPRCMRLPGFVHQKDPEHPHAVSIVSLHPDNRYSFGDIQTALRQAEEAYCQTATSRTAHKFYSLDRGHPDGERTHALTSLAGTLINKGFDDDEALKKLKEWNQKNTPSLSEDKIYKTFFSIRTRDNQKMSELDLKLRNLDDRYRIVKSGGTTSIFDEVSKDFCKVQSFKDYNRNLKHGDKQLTTIWMEKTLHRYPSVTFDPSAPPGGQSTSANNQVPYNLWRGFAILPIKGQIDLYLEHVRDIICDGNPDVFEYVINYLAHMVQKPKELPEVAIVLQGLHGVGKGRFLAPFQTILGCHFKEFTQLKQLLGQFNSHLGDVLMLHANEATWGGNKQQEGALKAMITEKLVAYEAKFRGIEMLQNYKRLIISSNNDWVVPVALTERRFLVLNPSEKRRNDHAYFNALTKEIENGGSAALLYYLLNHNISKFNPRVMPNTTGLTSQKFQSMCGVGIWLQDALQNGAFHRDQSDSPLPYDDFVPTSELLDSYLKYARNDRYRHGHVSTCQQLVTKLKDYLAVQKKRRQYERPCGGTVDTRGLVFPSLEDAKKQFEAKVGGEIEWDEEIIEKEAEPQESELPEDLKEEVDKLVEDGYAQLSTTQEAA